MKNTFVKVCKTLIKVLKAVLHFVSAGHICSCEKKDEDKENN